MTDAQDPTQAGRPEDPTPPSYPSYPGQPTEQPPGYGYPAAGPTPPGAYGPYAYGPVVYQLPKHPSATTAMVLGIVAVAGGVMCYLPVLAAPFAWWLGHKAVQEIDASGGQMSGRSEAKAGFVLGIIGTILLILAIAVIALLVVLTITVDDFWDEDYEAVFRLVRNSLALSVRG